MVVEGTPVKELRNYGLTYSSESPVPEYLTVSHDHKVYYSKCPHCGSHKTRFANWSEVHVKEDGKETELKVGCAYCGQVFFDYQIQVGR